MVVFPMTQKVNTSDTLAKIDAQSKSNSINDYIR